MQARPADTPRPASTAGVAEVSEQVGEADLSALFADLKAAERFLASAVRRAGVLAGSGVAEKVEGGPLDWVLSMACHMTSTDARFLVGAAEMLKFLPTVDRLFADGVLSWGQVRRITAAARKIHADQRALLDARVAAAVDAYDGIDAFDPDHLCDAVDAAADQLRDARAVQRQEAAAARGNVMIIQARTDGGATAYMSGDAVGMAPIIGAIDTARVHTTTNDQTQNGTTRPGLANFTALGDICGEYLTANNSDLPPTGGGEASQTTATRERFDPAAVGDGPVPGRRRRRRARPLLTVHLDLSQFTLTPQGTIELNVPGALPRVSAAVAEILARDAEFRAVIFDGKRPLALSRKTRAEHLPADTRLAVRARDGGDRFPGSRQPIARTDIHHIQWRSRDGTHHPDDLVSLSRTWHTRVHQDGWQLTLIPHTGELRAKRRHRTWRSLPKTHRPAPPASPPAPAAAQQLTRQQPHQPHAATLPF